MNEMFDNAGEYRQRIIKQYEAEWQEDELPHLLQKFQSGWQSIYDTTETLSCTMNHASIKSLAATLCDHLLKVTQTYDHISAIMLSGGAPDDVIGWADFVKRQDSSCQKEFLWICSNDVCSPEDEAVLLSMGEAYASNDTTDGTNDFLKATYYDKYARAIDDVLGYAICHEQAQKAFCEAAGIEYIAAIDEDEEEYPPAESVPYDDSQREMIATKLSPDITNFESWIRGETKDIPQTTLEVAVNKYDVAELKMLEHVSNYISVGPAKDDKLLIELEDKIDQALEELMFMVDVLTSDNTFDDASKSIEKIIQSSHEKINDLIASKNSRCLIEPIDPVTLRMITETLLHYDEEEPHMTAFGMTPDTAVALLKKYILHSAFLAKRIH